MADLPGDDTPNAFCAHPDLPLVAAEILCLKHCFYLSPNDSRYPSEWVAKLAHLNASVAANTLARLSASDIAGRIADELNRRNNENKYLRPFVWAGVWRDPRGRRDLQRILRQRLSQEGRQRFLAGIHTAVHDEPRMRAIQIATLLIEQAELAAQPLCPEEAVRLIERARKLRRIGEVEIARLCEERALQLARDHESYFLNETWRRNAMIRTAAKRFFWYFWMRGDRLVAGLVGEALGRKINPRRVRYIVAGR